MDSCAANYRLGRQILVSQGHNLSKTPGAGPSIGTELDAGSIREVEAEREPGATLAPRPVQFASTAEALASARRIMEKYDPVLVELAK
ncbi:hypothetical protein Sa4125_43770 [Aureimonas sp. SA4125]|nr:hypothetical protein Sa4125_43770 [Aureimonas sp. SA4125]